MHLRTFTANSMGKALGRVRHHMGPHAVVLHTRHFRQGGVLGLGSRRIVEVTATDDWHIVQARRCYMTDYQPAGWVPPHRERYDWDSQETAGDLIRRTYAIACANVGPQDADDPIDEAAEQKSDHAVEANQVTTNNGSTLVEEVALVRQMVSKVLDKQDQLTGATGTEIGLSGLSPDLYQQYLDLIKQEVSEDLARDIVSQVDAADEPLTPQKLRSCLQDRIASLLPADQSAGTWSPTADGRPRVIALIGPTGVGKTTTIAKLAAHFKLKHHRKVGLITLDTFRIAAVDQLKTYADILGAPMHVVTRQAEMSNALENCNECDIVLIDTVGRSPKDEGRLDELGKLIAAADPHEVHLVLSSTCTQSAMLAAIEKFSRIRTDRIIFTKLDEAVTLGVILNVIAKVNKQLSFLTTGQEVPYHIEPSDPRRLAAMLLGDPDDANAQGTGDQ